MFFRGIGFLALLSLFSFGQIAQADIALVLQDTLGFARPLFQGGHAAFAMDRVCFDVDQNKYMICRTSDHSGGIVLGRYMWLSEETKLDFVAVPFDPFFYGTLDAEKAPLIANHKILMALSRQAYEKAIMTQVKSPQPEQGLADGRWRRNIGSNMMRNSYLYWVQTSTAEDEEIVEILNSHIHKGNFNLLTNNCSHMVKRMLGILFPGMLDGNKRLDLFTTTPTGVAKTLLKVAQENQRSTEIQRVRQIPGTFYKSGPVGQGKTVLAESMTTLGALGVALAVNPIAGVAISAVAVINPYDPSRYFRSESQPDWKGIGKLVEQVLSEPVIKATMTDVEIKASRRKGKALQRYLEKAGEFVVSQEGEVVLYLKRGNGRMAWSMLSETGLNRGNAEVAFLVSLSRVQYWRGLTSRLSARHRPSVEEMKQDLDRLMVSFARLAQQYVESVGGLK